MEGQYIPTLFIKLSSAYNSSMSTNLPSLAFLRHITTCVSARTLSIPTRTTEAVTSDPQCRPRALTRVKPKMRTLELLVRISPLHSCRTLTVRTSLTQIPPNGDWHRDGALAVVVQDVLTEHVRPVGCLLLLTCLVVFPRQAQKSFLLLWLICGTSARQKGADAGGDALGERWSAGWYFPRGQCCRLLTCRLPGLLAVG